MTRDARPSGNQAHTLRSVGTTTLSSLMAYTEFTDRAGRCWRVWYTLPKLADALTILPQEWKEGWLTFESEGEKRRLAPVPSGWERLSPERLELLSRMAQPTIPSARHRELLRREERRPE